MPASAPSSLRGSLLWVGLLLMCVGVALTAFLYFLFIISVPIVLLGFVLVLVSGQPAWRIALAASFPFMAWVGIATGAWALAPREQPATFLIPEGFEGTILLIKNEQCGPPPEYENGRRLYRVPASGLLITRDTVPNREYYQYPNKGYNQRPDNEYYLVDGQGRRLHELPEVYAATNPESNPEPTSTLLGVGRDELAAFYDTPMESQPDSAGIGYFFQYLTITTQNRRDRPELQDAQFRTRLLADSLLPRCRVRIGQPLQGLWKPEPNAFEEQVFDSTAN